MDLHGASSQASSRDPKLPAIVTANPSPGAPVELSSGCDAPPSHPGSDAWFAEQMREREALEALENEITELWGHINAATARFLSLLAEFDRRGGWKHDGIANCAHWLSWQCGIGPVAAREKVRVARALESLPKIRAAFGEGRLSYTKVRTITRVATQDTEESLLHIGLRGTAAHVERTVRYFRRVLRGIERNEAGRMHEGRYLDCRRQSDGVVKLEACLTPEVGEMLIRALEAAQAELEGNEEEAENGEAQVNGTPSDSKSADASESSNTAPENVSAETSVALLPGRQPLDEVPEGASAETPTRTAGQRRADALGHILERFLGGKCSGSAASAHEVVVHIAHDALRDVPVSTGAEFENGKEVAVETARRLGCDGALVGVVKGSKGEPLAVGRRTRAVPPAIRRALRIRDKGCRFPGCDRTRYVHAHHIKHWADGGETNLDNLVTLCSEHHRLVHEGGYGVHAMEGEIAFTHTDGRELSPAGKPIGLKRPGSCCFRGNNCVNPGDCPAINGATRLAESNAARGVKVDAATARCGWTGERMDYSIAIDNLCQQAGYH